MGLDMYLTRKVYIGAEYKHRKIRVTLSISMDGEEVVLPAWQEISEIIYKAGYWRKANHIHNWFVEKVQNGIDECQESYVSNSNIRELYNLCVSIVDILDDGNMETITKIDDFNGKKYEVSLYKNRDEVLELLPTSTGFFFGSCEIDSYYKQDCIDTIEILEPLLDCKDEIYYQSSW